MSSLLITLGHGSSAILVHEGRVMCGFENERLTTIKSDSQFPEAAISRIRDLHPEFEVTEIFVSHWFMTPELPVANSKWDKYFLRRSFPKAIIHTLHSNFTHHDAHMVSAKVFAGDGFLSSKPHGLVCDGFGTYGEVISLYEPSTSQRSNVVMKRVFGFNLSLGLMYQYATTYLHLKPHQDEYKLLGYAAQLDQVDFADGHDESTVKLKMQALGRNTVRETLLGVSRGYDPMVSIGALPKTAQKWYDVFDKFCEAVLQDSDQLAPRRRVIAALVQTVLESVISGIIDIYDIKNLVVSGGVFMNVALNNTICRKLTSKKGQLCVMPLCGDSGAALGVYHHYVNDLTWPSDLFWGHRGFSDADYERATHADIVVVDSSEQNVASTIRTLLRRGFIVNVVQGSMEYGPRALGHTSTLALPTLENVAYINKCNNRSTVMPMAGVCRDSKVKDYHDLADQVHKSMEYMTCALDFCASATDSVKGAALHDKARSVFTGRTQVVNQQFDSVIYDVLDNDDMPMVINTSFNPHGKPIVYSMDDIISAHHSMNCNDIERKVFTIIIK